MLSRSTIDGDVLHLNVAELSGLVGRGRIIHVGAVFDSKNERLFGDIFHRIMAKQHIPYAAAVVRAAFHAQADIGHIHNVILGADVFDPRAGMATGHHGAVAFAEIVIKDPRPALRLLMKSFRAFTKPGGEIDAIISGIEEVVENQRILAIAELDAVGVIAVKGLVDQAIEGDIFDSSTITP